jgi:hypothetical protein
VCFKAVAAGHWDEGEENNLRYLSCQSCGQSKPMNELYRVFDRQLCEPCGNKELESRNLKKVPKGTVEQLADPTVCQFCKADHGSLELPQMAGLPACPGCEDKFLRPKPPWWVTTAAAVILLLAITELSRNWRLFQAYFEIPRAGKAVKQGDVAGAWRHAARAADLVPEVHTLRSEEQFLHAMCCMQKHDSDRAIALLEEVRLGPDKEVSEAAAMYLMVAKASKCLDNNENAEALRLARLICEQHPDNNVGRDLVDAAMIGSAFDRKDYAAFEAKAR